ncbi:ATP-binding protein [Noviherbaspirillum humi]|uniref:ATP-binding protein n=1 Tax=Noviherbaspirillum humi TaxID=1688639 RepID=UPI001595100B|nr:ATP-binding protein [Noviherbaspirillum humi]
MSEHKELEIYRRVFHASPDYIAFSRLSDGTFIDVNPGFERLLGFRREQVVGRTSFDVGIWPDGEEQQRIRYAELLRRDGMVKDYPGRLRTADGRIIEVEASANVVSIDGEQILIAIVRDVTERKRAETALREADRRKDEFLAMLAHELRNPLAPISMAARLLTLAPLDASRVQHASQVIARQASHMASLVDDLLDVSRVTRGLVTLRKETMDLKSAVSDAAEQARALIENRRHHLCLELDPQPALVHADRLRVVQIVANLLTNAAKYTPEGGRIALAVQVLPDRVQLRVKDNGIGMAPELMPHVFELFTQGERSPDRSQGGLGLGLALVKSLVELHGGGVAACSDGRGAGSEFSVWLPRAASEGNVMAAASATALPPARPLRILVVDDNIDAAETLALFLRSQGHAVRTAYRAEQALALAASEPPEVCILDIGLPEVDGYQLARRLRECGQTCGATLIALTGYGQESDMQQSRAAGFDRHLVKPVDTRLLATELSGL